ncbi:MAG: acetolactate decarboxylase [Kiritimatiellae bacterium]|jgi:acetolactate decarboxylase|nr:acetolactate decarboxylase [Kiritimatiellia bacterium]
MNKLLSYFVFVISLIAFGCKTIPTNTVTQVSTINSLKANKTDALISTSDLDSFGNFGMALKEGIEGQVIVNNNRTYEIDEKFHALPAFGFTPLTYATMVNFNWDTQLNITSRKKMTDLEKLIDQAVPNMDVICAIRIQGKFLNMKLTFVGAQKTEQIEYQDISGSMIGFRFPKYMKELVPEGYFFFFLADNKKNGGDVVDCLLQTGTVQIDLCNKINIHTAVKLAE